MISSGVGVNSVDSNITGNTALHWGASYGNEDVVRCLDLCFVRIFFMRPTRFHPYKIPWIINIVALLG